SVSRSPGGAPRPSGRRSSEDPGLGPRSPPHQKAGGSPGDRRRGSQPGDPPVVIAWGSAPEPHTSNMVGHITCLADGQASKDASCELCIESFGAGRERLDTPIQQTKRVGAKPKKLFRPSNGKRKNSGGSSKNAETLTRRLPRSTRSIHSTSGSQVCVMTARRAGRSADLSRLPVGGDSLDQLHVLA
ncbi:MAG: hypothetical protein JWL67_1477, partial [Solirubrobacterales bacterium]|nr:hypothetical protein [Solirubrobacterales bacterium]